jgi:hypothetical protein
MATATSKHTVSEWQNSTIPPESSQTAEAHLVAVSADPDLTSDLVHSVPADSVSADLLGSNLALHSAHLDFADSDVESDTTSITSSVKENVIENRRTYHGYNYGKYPLPNDDNEKERLDFQHHLFKRTFNGLLPFDFDEQLHRVLDLGTGTGIWALEFSRYRDRSHRNTTVTCSIKRRVFDS